MKGIIIMKKALSVLLVIAMSLTLFCACSDNKTKEKTEGDFSYVALEDNTAKITKFNKTDDIITLEIPATLGDMTVTVIGEGAFANAQNLTVVYAPETLITIEKGAFAGSSVKKAFLHHARGLKTIAENAFAECHKLIQVDISDGVDTIGEHAFYYCENLKVVTFRGNPANIHNFAFDSSYNAKFYVLKGAANVVQFAHNHGYEAILNG